MFGLNKDSFRQQFLATWEKHKNNLELSPLEKQILDVLQAHPEYHAVIENLNETDESEKSRAFMHMGLHIALVEQVSTDRPVGIRDLFIDSVKKLQHVHVVEHHFMDVLGQFMWEMARENKAPDDNVYLEKLRSHFSKLV